jgi:hypothetical protein
MVLTKDTAYTLCCETAPIVSRDRKRLQAALRLPPGSTAGKATTGRQDCADMAQWKFVGGQAETPVAHWGEGPQSCALLAQTARRKSGVSTETGEAPSGQGAMTENIGIIRGRSNADRRDVSPVESCPTFAPGCQPEARRRTVPISLSKSTGLVRCSEKPAARLREMSSSEPYPLTATAGT